MSDAAAASLLHSPIKAQVRGWILQSDALRDTINKPEGEASRLKVAHPLCMIAADVAASRAAFSRTKTRLFTSGRTAFGVNTQQSADQSRLPQFVSADGPEVFGCQQYCNSIENNTGVFLKEVLLPQTEHFLLKIPSELLQSGEMSDL